jgi:hypothetical protein
MSMCLLPAAHGISTSRVHIVSKRRRCVCAQTCRCSHSPNPRTTKTMQNCAPGLHLQACSERLCSVTILTAAMLFVGAAVTRHTIWQAQIGIGQARSLRLLEPQSLCLFLRRNLVIRVKLRGHTHALGLSHKREAAASMLLHDAVHQTAWHSKAHGRAFATCCACRDRHSVRSGGIQDLKRRRRTSTSTSSAS